jgi:homoserine kinase type II
MPGGADFAMHPNPARMIAACDGLSRIHAVWRKESLREGPCPAVERRLDRLDAWENAIGEGWEPQFAPGDADLFSMMSRRTWLELPVHLNALRPLLEPLRAAPFRLHTCLGDIWHDNVLFEKDQLTGIIDYGAMRVDTPAVDLARLLGSLAPRDEALYATGLKNYLADSPLSRYELRLVRILDYSGTVIGAANWLLWTYREMRPLDDRVAAAKRLEALLDRLASNRFSI